MKDELTLSERELKALTLFVVGLSSEGSLRGKDVSARLSFAGRYMDGRMVPVENSGLTIGMLQKDLGQDRQETAKALVLSFQEWALANSPSIALDDAERISTINDLARTGRVITSQDNRSIDAGIRTSIDEFLSSRGGREFVHKRDVAQVSHIYNDALLKL